MKLYERFGERGYHTSIITSFGVDFDTYENVVLTRLRGAGCYNNVVLCDRALLAQSLSESFALPRHAGRLYTANGVKTPSVFHPKLFIQLGRNGGRIIVSSANLTASGLAGNLELAGEFSCGAQVSGEQRLVALAWAYVLRHCDRTGEALDAQLTWAEARTPWLKRAAQGSGETRLADGTKATLLTSGERVGIGELFLAQIDDLPVNRLVVISPYWDQNLSALRFVATALSPAKTDLLIDCSAGLFPVEALAKLPRVRLFDREEFRKGRFLHAKAVIAQTRNADHVLYGSANCTIAALGTKGVAGENEEVCIYQRCPPGTVLDSLELTGVLEAGNQIDASQVQQAGPEDELDRDVWLGRSAGRFECSYDTLIWTPPANIDPDTTKIDLLGAEKDILHTCVIPTARRGSSIHYEIAGLIERPAFAVLLHSDGTVSAPSIVVLVDEIRQTAKEARSKKAEEAVSHLAEETEEGLWLLDILDTLESAERLHESGIDAVSTKTRAKKAGGEQPPERFRLLSYEDFVAGRKPRAKDSLIPRNSLAGSELSLVRGFLNRLLNIADQSAHTAADEGRELDKAFDLGDETADAERVVDRGEFLDTDPEDGSPEDKQRREKQRQAVQRKATLGQIADAVSAFNERASKLKADDRLTTFDVLRLRALLMIVCAAGWARRSADHAQSKGRTSLQVLPVENGTDSWPRLMGRVLFAFFGGNDPAIRHVQLAASHEQLADDLLECWATCFWCVHACLEAPCSKEEHSVLARYITPLAEKLYRLTGLSPDEALGSEVGLVMQRMSERFAGRLELDAAALGRSHDQFVRHTLN